MSKGRLLRELNMTRLVLAQTTKHLSHSTISSALNAMSLVTLEDIIKKKIPLTDAQATKISKVVGERQSFSNVS